MFQEIRLSNNQLMLLVCNNVLYKSNVRYEEIAPTMEWFFIRITHLLFYNIIILWLAFI